RRRRRQSDRLRVVYVLGTLERGGTETQVVRLAVEMKARGHDVRVVALSGGGPLEAVLHDHAVECHVFAYRGLRFRDSRRRLRPWLALVEVGQVMRLAALLVRTRPDVCHALLFWAYTIAMPLAWLARVPVRVNGRRGYPPERPGGLPRRMLDGLSGRSSSCYVANSHRLASDCARLEGVDESRFVVIHNGVDIPEVAAHPESEPATAVVVANLIAYKGHADLLVALSSVAPTLTTVLIGDGPERAHLAGLAARLELGDRVVFGGAVPDAAAALGGYQLSVLASHHEGFPNAVLEAMAAGLPVVATDVGGVPELVRHGVDGLLVPPRDPGALAAAIGHLVGDPSMRSAMGAAGRDRVGDFSWPSCVDRHIAVYSRLLADGR
ncbi:MAG TPA: glycosyltransferase, partial [Acidimicrobiales bacterium]|nr:glycosyltransferase [Acidimicrobiales bacterium]